MDRDISLSGYSFSSTDLIRFIIISSLSVLCVIITTYSISRNLGTIYAQLFYFPIIYATYFYPRRGLFLAGACAIIYQSFAYFYLFPDTGGLISVTVQSLLFVCIGALVAFISEKLNTSEKRSRSIVEKSQLGIIVFEKKDYTIRLTNTHLENMLGYSTEELAGMKFPELISSPEERKRFVEFVASGEVIRNFEIVFMTREKESIWVSLSWSRITENLMSCTVIDINTFRLRSPLQPTGVTEETRLILNHYTKSMDREQKIINQILELSEVESRKITPDYSVFSLPELLKTVIDAGKYRTQAHISIDVPLDLMFNADKKKITAVLNTMLSNAVKYSSPPRKIDISYRSSPDDPMHHLSIRDNGIGITDARLDEIFEPFTISDSGNKTLKFDKIGLDLAIAKKYIKMHGGYITVDSIINLETTFSIHIPKIKPAEVEHNAT
jgi:PAS domain S-box-containing protein